MFWKLRQDSMKAGAMQHESYSKNNRIQINAHEKGFTF